MDVLIDPPCCDEDACCAVPPPPRPLTAKSYDKFDCITCGGHYTRYNRLKHEATKKHVNAVKDLAEGVNGAGRDATAPL